ncbi:MAG: PLD nuclease N-terminal domain-containing protein [Acidobacteriota bacterium]
MGKVKQLVLASLSLLFASSVVLAQRQSASNDAESCAACGSCGVGLGVLILVPLVFFALNIALLVWVARDAKSRGMDSSVLWMVLVMFTSIVGLIIYIFSRPQGDLVQCSSCGNNRLQVSAKCPHCGNA